MAGLETTTKCPKCNGALTLSIRTVRDGEKLEVNLQCLGGKDEAGGCGYSAYTYVAASEFAED